MDTSTINIELEHYVGDRLKSNDREAFRRLYLRAVAHCAGPALTEYLHHLRRRALVYASICHLLKSPFRHIESPLFLSSLSLVTAGIIMMASGGFSEVVACGTSAGIVGMIHCGRRVLELWLLHDVEEAVFRELAENLLNETTEPGHPA